jgi:hypothetical protein
MKSFHVMCSHQIPNILCTPSIYEIQICSQDMSQDVPNSKTIPPLISALEFNLYKCGKWSFIISYNKLYIHLTYYIRYFK